MKMLPEGLLKRDLIKLACLMATIAGAVGIFIVTPALSTPTVLSIVIAMLLSPLVAALERRGWSRALAIAVIFLGFGAAFAVLAWWGIQGGQAEWYSFKEKAPEHFQTAITKLRAFETSMKGHYPFLQSVHPTDSLLGYGQNTGKWFVQNGPALVGSFVTWLFILPPLTFVMLNDGRAIRQRFYQLVPNRFFESFFIVSNEIADSISDYLRAKLVEATLVGVLTLGGMLIIGAPYAAVLAVFAGITNIIPYVGPLMGAVPGVLIASFDSTHPHLVWPVVIVYAAANIIDTFVIFPVVVAKLVNLHPLILIAVVAVGQTYYGLVG
ncbi:MAG: AI-2E family transporter, partial [Bdellovibrionota bacterium]